MKRFWSSMPRTKQNLLLAFVAGIALLVFFGVEMQRMDKKARQIAAQIDMREKRKRNAAPAGRPSAATADPRKLAEERRLLEKQVADLASRVETQEARLAPLDDPGAQQRLQLALARLAQESDVEMEGFRLIDETRNRDEKLAPTVERLRKALANDFKRPLYLFSAKASYHGLMQVLAGLGGFEYAVVPVDLAVRVQVELAPKRPNERERRVLRQWLDVQMILAF